LTSTVLSRISHKRHGRRAGYDDFDEDIFDACDFDAFEFVVLVDFECTIKSPVLATSVNDTRRE